MSDEQLTKRCNKRVVVRVSLYEGVDDDLMRELDEIASKYRRSARVVELMRLGLERLRNGGQPTMMVAAVPAPPQPAANGMSVNGAGARNGSGLSFGASPEEEEKIAAAVAEKERAVKELRVRQLSGLFGAQA